jgi:hypothetical protein
MADEEKADKLPVTAEIGDEGGSYAEATQQADTFSEVFGSRRTDPKAISATGTAAGPQRKSREPEDEVTHATEDPAGEQ